MNWAGSSLGVQVVVNLSFEVQEEEEEEEHQTTINMMYGLSLM